MKLDAVIKWFMPKEERFHELFRLDTANLKAGAYKFGAIARSTSLDERRLKMVVLEGLENTGDDLTRKVFEALNSTFVTPLDREDIRELASDLDDILDYLEGVARVLILFELSEAPDALVEFASILERMADEIDAVTARLWDLSQSREISNSMVRISDLENQADVLYQTVIADLFKSGRGGIRNPIEIMEWKEIYDGLENACDACKEFTHVVGNIMIKNA